MRNPLLLRESMRESMRESTRGTKPEAEPETLEETMKHHLTEKLLLCGQWSKNNRPIFVWPPLANTRFFYKGFHVLFLPQWLAIWLFPMMLAGLGFFLQNFQLRIGTYYYVHQMMEFDLQMSYHNFTSSPNDIPLSLGRTPEQTSFGSLNDPIAEALGKPEIINIAILDALAVAFPALFSVMVVMIDSPYIWTRIMLSFMVLAVGKGLFSWITVVPDSNGWRVCRERLAASRYDVQWYAEQRSVQDIFFMDPRTRLCADMMWSGHTYFVAIFALGLHETVRNALYSRSTKVRVFFETLIAVAAFSQQGVEIYLVLKSRFHYTSDVAMAVFVTYLVYTNGTIAVLASWWLAPETLNHEEAYTEKLSLYKIKRNRWIASMHPSGVISLGCCCCASSQQYIYTRGQLLEIMDLAGEATRVMGQDAESGPGDMRCGKEARMAIRESVRMVDDHDEEAAEAKQPMCPDCRVTLKWSSQRTDFHRGWTCSKFHACGNNAGRAGPERWLCDRCMHDFCSSCVPASHSWR